MIGLSQTTWWLKTRGAETRQVSGLPNFHIFFFFFGHSGLPLSPVFLIKHLGLMKPNPFVLDFEGNTLSRPRKSQDAQVCGCAAVEKSLKSWRLRTPSWGAHPRPSASPRLCK